MTKDPHQSFISILQNIRRLVSLGRTSFNKKIRKQTNETILIDSKLNNLLNELTTLMSFEKEYGKKKICLKVIELYEEETLILKKIKEILIINSKDIIEQFEIIQTSLSRLQNHEYIKQELSFFEKITKWFK